MQKKNKLQIKTKIIHRIKQSGLRIVFGSSRY